MKTCTKCGVIKPLDAFYRNTPAAPGHKQRPEYRPRCKDCFRADVDSRPKANRDPAKKAEYARRIGARTCEYIPQAERQARAQAKQADCAAHVNAWASWLRKPNPFGKFDGRVHVWRVWRKGVLWKQRYATDPSFTAQERVRNQLKKKAKLFPKLEDLMRAGLRRRGKSPTVERVCGYTITQLASHLESLFTDGMNWQAFARGEIHIDHRVPQVAFDLSDEAGVRACWALSNLQPLWAHDNLTKGDRLDGVPARRARSTFSGSLETNLRRGQLRAAISDQL